MEIVGLAAALAAIGGALLWDLGTQRRHVQRARARWEEAGNTVQAGPIGTIAEGDLLEGLPLRRAFGALAVVDGQVRFAGHRTTALDSSLPLEALRWVGTRTRVKTAWNRRVQTPELVLHAETDLGWHVYCFLEGPLDAFAAQLAALAGLPFQAMGEVREDFGPAPAVRVEPDAASTWQAVPSAQPDPHALPPDWQHQAGLLYLAPDRLLFARAHAIPLARIQRVTAIAAGVVEAGNPFPVPLLRVEYDDKRGERQRAGFLVPNAGDWAGVLETRAAVVVEWHSANIDK
ncbi:MAG: hypothetical protein Kow00106_16860 [Anaerolineae bacterium]